MISERGPAITTSITGQPVWYCGTHTKFNQVVDNYSGAFYIQLYG